MKKLFISYSRDDLDTALKFERFFSDNGFSIWRDEHSIYGGQQWPKAIGEAIAANDAMLLLWSANSAESHFVEFEWTTALALRKTVIPCLLDDTALPPALTATNGIDCGQLEKALAGILASLNKLEPEPDAKWQDELIGKLREITATDPDQALKQATNLVSARQIGVTPSIRRTAMNFLAEINKKPIRVSCMVSVTLFALLLVAPILVLRMIQSRGSVPNLAQSPTPTIQPTTYLRGVVVDPDGNPIAGAEVRLQELPDSAPAKTTSAGDFRIDGIPRKGGELARIYVSKEGYKAENYYVTLPNPVRIKLEKIR